MADKDPPPDASNPPDIADFPEPPELTLGEPWAIAHDCELLREHSDGQLLTTAVIVCGQCEKPFRIDLLDDRVKKCAHCSERYTHVVLISHVDNVDIAQEAFTQIARLNGFGQPEEEHESDDEGGGESNTDT